MFVLVAAGTLTTPLVFPYAMALRANGSGAGTADGMPPLSVALQFVLRTALFLAPAAFLGMWAARRIGLGAPHLEHALDGGPEPARPSRTMLVPVLLWSIASSLLAFAIDAVFFHLLGVHDPAPEIHARIDVAWWRSGLASFWAPFSEEIFDRLGLMSLLAWLLMRSLRPAREGRGRVLAFAAANLATALFFGWYHLSNEELFTSTLPSLVTLRTLLIVVPIGVVFGRLYQRLGLEAAILAHFLVDVIVHVVRPIAERLFV